MPLELSGTPTGAANQPAPELARARAPKLDLPAALDVDALFPESVPEKPWSHSEKESDNFLLPPGVWVSPETDEWIDFVGPEGSATHPTAVPREERVVEPDDLPEIAWSVLVHTTPPPQRPRRPAVATPSPISPRPAAYAAERPTAGLLARLLAFFHRILPWRD